MNFNTALPVAIPISQLIYIILGLLTIANNATPYVLRDRRSIDDIPTDILFMADEVGKGAKGVMQYLGHLIEGVDNVGDINEWITFMESYLSCEDTAWPYKPNEEKDKKSDLELITDFCTAWPRRWKCGNQLATKLNSLYGSEVGTDALRLSDSYVRFICRRKNDYLSRLAPVPVTHSDTRSLNCYSEHYNTIAKCVRQNPGVGICRNVQVLQECFHSSFASQKGICDTKGTGNWVNKALKQIKSDLRC